VHGRNVEAMVGGETGKLSATVSFLSEGQITESPPLALCQIVI
jgi:hypothetical protein